MDRIFAEEILRRRRVEALDRGSGVELRRRLDGACEDQVVIGRARQPDRRGPGPGSTSPRSWSTPGWVLGRVGFGGFNDAPGAAEQIGTWTHFAEQWGARPVLISSSRISAVAARHAVTIADVARLAAEHIAYDGDVLQEYGMLALADPPAGRIVYAPPRVPEPRRVAVLIRNLVNERAEAVEQLLVLTESYAPELYEDAARIAEDHRGKKKAPAKLFDEMRDLYGSVIEAFEEHAKRALSEGRFEEALAACDGFTYGLGDRDLRNEIFAHKGRWTDFRAKERKGVPDEVARNQLRLDMLATIDTIATAAVLPPPAPVAVPAPSTAAIEEPLPDTPPERGAAREARPGTRFEGAVIGSESDVVLSCENLGKRYKGSRIDALSGVSLSIKRGRILGVVGMNAAGKSTLLSILAGDLAPSTGSVTRDGLERAGVALVPQKNDPWAGQLDDHLSLYAAYHGHTGARNDKVVKRTLTLLHLEPYGAYHYSELSAGYQTRCALARALVSVPRVLLLDEPLAALDPVAQYEFMAVLYANARFREPLLPIILSSQHVDVVESFADDMLVLQGGTPIFYGPTGALGADRRENVFEVRCALSEDALKAVLKDLGPRSIRPRADSDMATAGGLFEVRVPIRVGGGDVLEALQKGGVQPSHFMDLSRSSLALLLRGSL